jgi:hypothetical protein
VWLPLLAFRKLRAWASEGEGTTGLMPDVSGLAFGLLCGAVGIVVLLAVRQLQMSWMPPSVHAWLARLDPTRIRTDTQYRNHHQVDLAIAVAAAGAIALMVAAVSFAASRAGRTKAKNWRARRQRRKRKAARQAQLDEDRLRGPYRKSRPR